MNFPHPLWGATLDSLEIDLLGQRIVMKLHIEDSSLTHPLQYHILELREVSEFRWHNSIPGPWNYVEVTEIYVRPAADDTKRVSMMLWSEDAGLSMAAKSVLLDGVEDNTFADSN
jgi:hypothetical protein